MKAVMPTPAEFNAAEVKLVAMGWAFRLSMMADDAKKPGVTNFGKLYGKGAGQFWLNFKTIGEVEAMRTRKPHDAGRESDLPEHLRPW